MTFVVLAGAASLVALVWSADRFVSGAAHIAHRLGVPPLLIGMVIVGFGTSLPELTVSVLAAAEGSAGVALGNAYGSNTVNIALILGVTALIAPVRVQSRVLRNELPILTGISVLAAAQLWDRSVGRADALILLLVFAILLAWTIRRGLRDRDDALGIEIAAEMERPAGSFSGGMAWAVVGLGVLVASSRVLVWSAVEVARAFGVSDLVVGLTVVALGTSLPELASSVVAALRREPDIALGNVIGSNLFNVSFVIGTAGLVRPLAVAPEILSRDMPVMLALTISLFLFGYGFRGPGRINRVEGGVLVVVWAAYVAWMAVSSV